MLLCAARACGDRRAAAANSLRPLSRPASRPLSPPLRGAHFHFLAPCTLRLSYRAPHRADAQNGAVHSKHKRTAVQAILDEGRVAHVPKRVCAPQRLTLRFKGVSGLDCAQLERELGVGSGVLPITVALYEERIDAAALSESDSDGDDASDNGGSGGRTSWGAAVGSTRTSHVLLEAFELPLPLLAPQTVALRKPVCTVEFETDLSVYTRAYSRRSCLLVVQLHKAASQIVARRGAGPDAPTNVAALRSALAGEGAGASSQAAASTAVEASSDGKAKGKDKNEGEAADEDATALCSEATVAAALANAPPRALVPRPSARGELLSPSVSLHEHPREGGAQGQLLSASIVNEAGAHSAWQYQNEREMAAARGVSSDAVAKDPSRLGAGCMRPRPVVKLDVSAEREASGHGAEGEVTWTQLQSFCGPQFTSKLPLQPSLRRALLVDGRYDVLMQRTLDTAPLLASAEPAVHFNLHWRSDAPEGDAAGAAGGETAQGAAKVAGCGRAAPSPSSTKAPGERRARRTSEEPEEAAHPEAKGEGAATVDTATAMHMPDAQPLPPPVTVFVHYMYNRNTQRLTDARRDVSCPFCHLFCGSFDGMLMHLTCCHDRVRFRLTKDSRGNPHVHVQIAQPLESSNAVTNGSAASSSSVGANKASKLDATADDEQHQPSSPFIFARLFRAASASSISRDLVRTSLPRSKRAASESDDDGGAAVAQLDALDVPLVPGSFGASDQKRRRRAMDVGNVQEVPPLEPERQYFHSRTGMPLTRQEMCFDSDDEVDDEWILQQSEKVRGAQLTLPAHFTPRQRCSCANWAPGCCPPSPPRARLARRCWMNSRTCPWKKRSS